MIQLLTLETIGEIMADGESQKKLQMNLVVFGASVGIIVLMLVGAVVATDTVAGAFNTIQAVIMEKFGWLYVLSITGFLLFAFWIMQSRFGRIKLGPDDCEPDFGMLTWFAMLFSAGMGIGLLFFSVAEPMSHYGSPPSGVGNTLESARGAMGVTFFHWGLHGWAVYSVVGLCFAYFSFRRGLPLSIRSAFHPLLGDKINGPIGDFVDTLAVVSTLFGVATSLGLGAMQVNAGLNHVFGVPESITMQVVIIGCITAMATASVVSGLDVGIRRLSELNMGLAVLLLIFVFVAGPTAFILNAFVDNIGSYLTHLPRHSFWVGSFSSPQEQTWLSNWTIFYWAWWIAWTPFVSMFIARVSRGRTIREYMGAVLVAPTLAGFVWLTVFGDAALFEEIYGGGGIASAVNESIPTALFVLLDRYPLASITGLVATVCVILFFITSSDSASLVVDTIASGGVEDPPVIQRVFWAVFEGVVAGVLLFAGGLKALQTASLTTALPFCFAIIVMCWALVKGLREDALEVSETEQSKPDS
ncbi:MAG: BCCT family transporter [Myxococcota bacterium]|nr:BCCT family transporter [Myxococcota bacterium]